MTKSEFNATLQAVGAKLVRHEALPAGPGVFDDEVGGEGPWLGILFEHGYTYGWVREDCAESLYDAEIFSRHVGANVAIRRLAHALAEINERSCRWDENEGGAWETSCHGQFETTYNRPDKNGMIYCCFCGKRIEQIDYEETEDTDD